MSAATGGTLPLIAHRDLAAPLAWRDGEPIAAGRFLADVARLAALLPAGRHVLNVCADRYRFAVGLAASLVADKVSLLPSTHTAETVRQLRDFAADTFCLTDADDCDIALPQLRFPETGADWRDEVPQIPAHRLVACVFTSGSTGTPVPHRKSWGALVANARVEARRLGLDDGRRHVLVGTVPPQHMYGFESTVLMALHAGGAFWAGRPFYPADIEAALAAVPRPRALVSTPFHLRTLLAAGSATPAADLVLSATAPLSANLAREVEARLACPLYEIYGCTETGQLATRRPVEGAQWTLFDGVSLELRGEQAWAFGGHVEQPTALSDVIEVQGAKRFLLHGRSSDLVNIAGKRTSLGWLNHQLNAIPGVIDGSFFMPDEDDTDGVVRLAACVVAPGMAPQALTRALRERLDPVFLPRPLVMVDALPRNATGKLPRAALADLLCRRGMQADRGETA